MLQQTSKQTRLWLAMNQAADHIESNPKDFDFCSVLFPHPCRTPGCALGWLTYFYTEGMGQPKGRAACRWIAGELGIDEHTFYNMLNRFQPRWRREAQACANALRQYADTYLMEPVNAYS